EMLSPCALACRHRWLGARMVVLRRPDCVSIQPYGHGFLPHEQAMIIAQPVQRFLEELLEYGERPVEFNVHFATAREAFNIAMAAVDGRSGEPGLYRDYLLRQIMRTEPTRSAAGSLCPSR